MHAPRERRKTDKRIHQIGALHALFAQKSSRVEYLRAVAELLKVISGCENVGIRLLNRQEEPHEAGVGFSTGFPTPSGDCICARPSNGLSEQEESFSQGACMEHRFASTLVLPVQYHGTTLGVIHFADHRSGIFGEELVQFLRGLTPLIGEAAHRFDIESDLRQSEERYRSLVQASAQIVWTTDPKGEVIDDVPSWRAFTGQSWDEVRGWGWVDALHPDDREQAEIVWRNALAKATMYQTEYRIRRANGDYYDFAVRGVPVRDPAGTIREWIGACVDVTERRDASRKILDLNQSLEQRAEQLGALATELTLTEFRERKHLAQVLHDELQQLLVAGKIRVDLLSQNPEILAQGAGHLQKLDQVIAESIKLCRSLMTELSPPLLTEIGVVAAVGALARQLKETHDLVVRVVSDYEIPADNEGICLLLFQAVRELLFNVVKHSGTRQALIRFSRLAGNRVEVEVSDQGVGFSAGNMRFRKSLATGLGLFGIRERIVQKGGEVVVESTVGKGTRVTIRMGIPSAEKEFFQECKDPVAEMDIIPGR